MPKRLARRRVEDLLAKRERYLAALVQIQQILLAQDSQDNHYAEILKHLGQTANASRAYIFQNRWDPAGRLSSCQITAWSADHLAVGPEPSSLPDMPLVERLPRWAALLEQEAVISGKYKIIQELARSAIDKNMSPQDILDGAIIPAMEHIGRLFSKSKIFIPEMLLAAKATESVLEILSPIM